MARVRQTPVRMERLATLPVFFKLEGRRVVLAGGGAPAVWKAELLSAAGARVEVYAAELDEELVALAETPPGGPIALRRRSWTEADLVGATLALGALEDDDEAGHFRDAAAQAGVPVNVIDKPAFCTFQFGTVVSRSPLVIGISTDGAAPVFGQAIRARIEALLPQSLRAWAEAARDWRAAVQARGLSFRARRRFWEVFAERALATTESAPTAADQDACLSAALAGSSGGGETQLALVGAGRGTPDGITLQAIRALQDADIVFHGSDVAPVLIGFARREAAKLALPAGLSAREATEVVMQRLRPGRHVWLDHGDPGRCRRWRDRDECLTVEGYRLTLIEGLGLCPSCEPDCPAWSAYHASSVGSAGA